MFEPHQPGTSLDTNNSRDKVLTELIRHNIHMTGMQHNMIPEITFALSVRHKELLPRPAHHTRRDGRRSLICVIRCISNLGDKGKLMSCARPVASPPLLVTPGDVTRDHLQTLTTPIHPIYKRQMAQSISKIRTVISVQSLSCRPQQSLLSGQSPLIIRSVARRG